MRYKCPECFVTFRGETRQFPYCTLKCKKSSRGYVTPRKRDKITMGQYHKMLERAQYSCEICHRKQQQFAVDHDHTTGQVRGILCYSCNTKLAIAESPKHSSRFLNELTVITYLERVISYQQWLHDKANISLTTQFSSKDTMYPIKY